MVECFENIAYYDDDFEEFLERFGAEIISFENDYAIVSTTEEKRYKLPYTEVKNRFDIEIGNEILMNFELIQELS